MTRAGRCPGNLRRAPRRGAGRLERADRGRRGPARPALAQGFGDQCLEHSRGQPGTAFAWHDGAQLQGVTGTWGENSTITTRFPGAPAVSRWPGQAATLLADATTPCHPGLVPRLEPRAGRPVPARLLREGDVDDGPRCWPRSGSSPPSTNQPSLWFPASKRAAVTWPVTKQPVASSGESGTSPNRGRGRHGSR